MESGKLLIGYALSDVVEEHKDLKRILESFSVPDTLELQPENFLWDVDKAKDYLKKTDFLSVHAASADLDLSSPDAEERYRSILATIKSMDLADYVGADTLVVHPINNMHLNPQERLQRKLNFLQTLKYDITPHYFDNNHKYRICLENIEYPKFPSTMEETLILTEEASNFIDAGMVIDVPHIWNSRRILNENPNYYKEWTSGFPNNEELSDYLNTFIDKYEDKIGLYHIAGFGDGPVRTHDPLDDEFIRREYLPIADNIKNKPIILEIHHPSHLKMIESREKLMKYFTK